RAMFFKLTIPWVGRGTLGPVVIVAGLLLTFSFLAIEQRNKAIVLQNNLIQREKVAQEQLAIANSYSSRVRELEAALYLLDPANPALNKLRRPSESPAASH